MDDRLLNGGVSISPRTRVGETTVVEPGCVIGPGVEIGEENMIGPNVVIQGPTVIGDGNVIMAGACLGTPARQRQATRNGGLGFPADAMLAVGDRNLIFEHVTVHLPNQGVTRIGNGVSIGPGTHVGHDSNLGDNTVIAPHCAIGGHATVGALATLGMGVRLHPRTVVGGYAICGMGAVVLEDVWPAETVAGVPARSLGVNWEGLARSNYGSEELAAVERWLQGGDDRSLPKEIRAARDEFEQAVSAACRRHARKHDRSSPSNTDESERMRCRQHSS